jgi:prepilin-type N-terminal cleavage/methylation domain-containing protein
MRRAFTLIEMLVVIGVMTLLLSILLSSLSAARLRAKLTVVNVELNNISLALESYAMNNKSGYPPTRADCNPDARDHWWALPRELVDSGYLPGGQSGDVIYAKVEDKFNPGYAYKYVAVGKKLDYYGSPMVQSLQISEGFPASENGIYQWYSDPKTSPVTWMVFSVGPKFDNNNTVLDGFPVSKQFWYTPSKRSGLVVRLRLLKGRQIGSYEGFKE